MRRAWRALVPALVLCAAGLSPAHAEDGKPDAPAAEEPQKSEGQLAFEQLSKELADAVAAWREASRARPASEVPPDWKIPPRPEPEFVKRFAEGAERFAGTEDAVPFLLQAAALGRSFDPAAGKEAVRKLAAEHAASPKLDQMTFTLMYGAHGFGEDVVVDAMTRIAEATPHANVKGAMLFARGAVVNRRGPKDDAERERAVADLRAAVDAAPETRYGEMAKGYIFELENLQVGMTAPDISGNDLEGVAFQLSDYRGQVVVLDFWGDW